MLYTVWVNGQKEVKFLIQADHIFTLPFFVFISFWEGDGCCKDVTGEKISYIHFFHYVFILTKHRVVFP